jgi:hypothetical protein
LNSKRRWRLLLPEWLDGSPAAQGPRTASSRPTVLLVLNLLFAPERYIELGSFLLGVQMEGPAGGARGQGGVNHADSGRGKKYLYSLFETVEELLRRLELGKSFDRS